MWDEDWREHEGKGNYSKEMREKGGKVVGAISVVERSKDVDEEGSRCVGMREKKGILVWMEEIGKEKGERTELWR